ncbi:MAG TPA: hypothetical protein VHW68_09355 [Actinomycetota bacterium]|nr:hypothetical protein [Actinomycetota bacterium]
MRATEPATPDVSADLDETPTDLEPPGRWIDGVVDWFRRRGPVGRGALALLLFTCASILVFALPVMGDLRNRCVGSCLGDTHLYMWSFEWMRYAIAHHQNPFFTSLIYAPEGMNLGWMTTLPGPALLAVPLTARFGSLFAVNVLMIAAPALAGWATYLVCVRVTKRFWPSIAGGAVFAFSTYMGQHMRAHLNLVLIFFVPLAVYLVLRRVDRTMGRILFVVLLGVVLAGQLSTSLELAATMTFFGVIAYLGALVVAPGPVRMRLLWTAPLVAASYLLAAVVALPILRNALQNPPTTEFRIPTANSIDLLGFVVPSAPARFGGASFAWLTDRFHGLPQDNTGYIGVALLAVAVLFLVRFRRELWAWAMVAFMLLIGALALGPKLQIAGAISVWAPQALMAKIPLIAHALPERFPAYVFLVLAVVTALWLAAGTGRSWWRYTLVAVGVVMMSVNLAWEPHYHAVDQQPAFFTDGSYQRYLQPDETVLAVPTLLGGELGWQVAADMNFRLARAYVGPVHAAGHEEIGLRPFLSEPGDIMPGADSLRYFLSQRHVGAVIVEEPVQPELTALLNDVLGTSPTSVGGVSVWQVPPDVGQAG